MEREANLSAGLPSSSSTSSSPEKDQHHPPPPILLADTHTSSSFTSSSSSSSSSSSREFMRDVQAAFKRHRPLGTMQSSRIFQPRRIFVAQRVQAPGVAEAEAGLNPPTVEETDNKLSQVDDGLANNNSAQVLIEKRIPPPDDDSSITPPSFTGTATKMDAMVIDPKEDDNNNNNKAIISPSPIVPQHISTFDTQKKVQFSFVGGQNSRADDGMDYLSYQMISLALTEVECEASNPKQQGFKHTDMSDVGSLRGGDGGGISSLLAKRSMLMQEQPHQFTAFAGKQVSHPMTQSSVVVDSSCVTTTSVHSRSVPMHNSTTYNTSGSCRNTSSHMEIEPVELKPQPIFPVDSVQPSYPTIQSSGLLGDQSHHAVAPTHLPISSLDAEEVREDRQSKGQQSCLPQESDGLKKGLVDPAKDSSHDVNKGKRLSGDITDVNSQAPMTNNSHSNTKLEPSKSDKPEKAASGKGTSGTRKKSYDPDLFFKVNGKLYQKLGKIGSGGSSEVHKVISAECTIYALKKIKLKGRDYSTAFGFCQEIDYLHKLKGKTNIIQLIDYEVTDKILLKEVLNGSMSIKDGRIRDDGYIYMVLEYGEIDLAHMLSQKWKEMDISNWNMDENWLRFYWQQILQAVKTIHEERIVHSDLKPANFLLVRGSLKLIDFGIAKAIMSDTTNIQRDSQVGTLSYMSPEAFMCNENDANGNAIKCGRPSDIWSLGCILYQMVYGRTPFSEYKTFWAKFKVITDRNHEITYGPVSNPWLLDLMKKCLAWERNDRWRIPQLLQHPFLVPPIPSHLSSPEDHHIFKILQQIADESHGNDHEASRLCSQIKLLLLTEPASLITSHISTRPGDQYCGLLSQISRLCSQLQQHLACTGKDVPDPSM